MNTNGRVHGKMIMDNPAKYAIINQEIYDASWFSLKTTSLVSEKITPTKISENKTKEINTIDFLAATCTAITSL